MAIWDYADDELTIVEKAERGRPLPNKLVICDIVELWSKTEREREIHLKILFKAYDDGKGKLQGITVYDEREPFFVSCCFHPLFTNNDHT